jgi:hypothetical protein
MHPLEEACLDADQQVFADVILKNPSRHFKMACLYVSATEARAIKLINGSGRGKEKKARQTS